MKILNLYACLGGNRYKWDEVAKEAGINIEVTAVELDEELAKLYKERFPNDTVIVADAHQYLLDNFKQYDFIWTSPPCPTHSRARSCRAISEKSSLLPVFPDLKLYEEIIFLKHFYKGKFVVENVISYYEPLIKPVKNSRHFYWSNFTIPNDLPNRKNPAVGNVTDELNKLESYHEIDLKNYNGKQSKIKIARNLVDYESGKAIFKTALGIISKQDTSQLQLL